MAATPRNLDTNSRLERLERLVTNLQRQSTLSSASISEGNLTIRRGGSIRVIDDGSIIGEGTGVLDWAGDAEFGGNLDIDGTTHIGGNLDIDGATNIGGNLTIDGNTFLGGTLTYGPGNRPDQVAADSTNATNWQATNGATIASLTIPRPSGYSNAVVLAQASGFYEADIDVPRACHPRFDLRINGTDFQIAHIPDNFGTYWIVGTFNREVSGSGNISVSVRTVIGSGCDLSPAWPENRMYLGALVVFIE